MMPRIEAQRLLDDFQLTLATAERGMEDEDRDSYLDQLRAQAAGGRRFEDATAGDLQDAGTKVIGEVLPDGVPEGFGMGG